MKASTATSENHVSAIYKPHMLNSAAVDIVLKEGVTLEGLLQETGIHKELWAQARIAIDGQDIPKSYWRLIKPKPCAKVAITLVPMGGDVLRLVAVVAVAALAPQVAIGLGAGGIGGTLLTVGVTLVGTLLVNSLFPPPTPQTAKTAAAESSSLSISGQSNQAYPYGPVRRVYGTHKVFPAVVGAPFTTTVGRTQYLYGLYDFGVGQYNVSDISIGDTPIAQFDGVTYNVRSDENFTIYTNDVNSESIGSALNSNGSTQTRNTDSGANGFEIDITFPSGLVGFNKDGSKRSRYVDLRVEYREAGSTTWLKPTLDNSYDSGSNVFIGDTAQISILPKEFSVGSIRGGSKYIGFDLRSSNTFSYTGGDPTAGKYMYIAGNKALISSVNTGANTVTLSSTGNYVAVSECRKSGRSGTGYVFSCPTPTYYKTKWGTLNTNGTVRIVDKRQNPVFASIGVRGLSAGEYEVKLTRLSDGDGGDYQNTDAATWSVLKTYKDGSPVSYDKTHTFVELKIKATDELSGVIDSLSAVCSSILPVWNGSAWVDQETDNPAWVFADIISGESASRPVPYTRLDTTSLKRWADWCDEVPVSDDEGKRFSCNFVVDYNTTTGALLDQVCASARATKTVHTGKWGVAIDEEKSIPVQTFTPRNSWGFSSTRSYLDEPQAVKVKFVNPDNDWQVSETIAYNDGYNESNATEFEELDAFACTSQAQAYRYGRYIMAQGILRQENVSINVDFENLRCTRGDLVTLVNDVMLVGGQPSRIKAIVGTTITIDEVFSPPVGTYGYEVRGYDGVRTGSISSLVDSYSFVVDDASDMEVGGLIVVGLVDELSADYLVKSISYNSDLSAQLSLIEYAPAVFTADTEEIPPYEPGISQGILSGTQSVEGLSASEVITFNSDGTANTYIDLSWTQNSLIVNSDVYLSIDGNDAVLLNNVSVYSYRYEVDPDDFGLTHQFFVDARNALGNHNGYLVSPSVTETPLGDVTLPLDIDNFRMSVISETIQLEWDQIIDPSLSHYEIRYNPSTATPLWATSQILISRVSKNTTTASVSSRVGTYLIKAVDGSGNYSENPSRIITTIPSLTNLNVIETVDDSPVYNGYKENVEVIDSKLSLTLESADLYQSSGWYEYLDVVDVGEIYTCRLTNKLQVNGRSQDDLMSDWATLADVDALQTWSDGDFGVQAYVRYASVTESMSDWATLAEVETLAQNENFTEWRAFTIGDYTGRFFQFAIELKSNGVVTPVITDATISIDMPDRIDSDNDIISSISGTRIDYSPAFKVKPAIQITQDAATAGDIWAITNHTRQGFDITFTNGGSPVSRQFDWMAKGYGRENAEVI